MPDPDAVRAAALRDLDPVVLYGLLRLRVDAFVVEQACPYPELDGRDVEPDALHLWVEADGAPAACLRLLEDPDGSARIGRVVTAPAHRGRGLSAALVRAALARVPGRRVVLDAQAHLEGWYAGFGFAADGPGFLEDGIPHVPMARRARGGG